MESNKIDEEEEKIQHVVQTPNPDELTNEEDLSSSELKQR